MSSSCNRAPNIAVVIPSYKVKSQILDVLKAIGDEVSRIYVIDDCCPEHTGAHVQASTEDSRIKVIRHEVNQGVGGAVLTGYEAAIQDGMDVIVKVDGDGQMDPALLPEFIRPILDGKADYTKGNRFFNIDSVKSMPGLRLIGNAALSFMNKLSSGYWNIFDPTNGYTAISADLAKHLPFEKISKRYFFETDMLFRLNTFGAVVFDIPMIAKYGDEVSNLKISKVIGEFFVKHLRNFFKRIFYNYYLRDVSAASIELPIGVLLFCYGTVYGAYHWINSSQQGIETPTGTIMLSALCVLAGLQFILAFISADVSSVPKRSISATLRHLSSSISSAKNKPEEND